MSLPLLLQLSVPRWPGSWMSTYSHNNWGALVDDPSTNKIPSVTDNSFQTENAELVYNDQATLKWHFYHRLIWVQQIPGTVCLLSPNQFWNSVCMDEISLSLSLFSVFSHTEREIFQKELEKEGIIHRIWAETNRACLTEMIFLYIKTHHRQLSIMPLILFENVDFNYLFCFVDFGFD